MEDRATALGDAIAGALEGWLLHCVRQRAEPAGRWSGAVEADAREAAVHARAEVMPALRALLAADIDEQATTPLSIVRHAVAHPTGVLRRAGVPPVTRDDDQRRRFPEDDYDLTPATFAELGETVAEAGIAWGAAKAFMHRQRHGGPR